MTCSALLVFHAFTCDTVSAFGGEARKELEVGGSDDSDDSDLHGIVWLGFPFESSSL